MVAHLHIRIAAAVLLVAVVGFSGCSNDSTSTGPGPVGSTFTLDEYSWSGVGDWRYITTTPDDTTRFYHIVNFRSSGDSVIATDFYSREGGGPASGELFSYRSDTAGLIFSSYTQDALIHLPASMSMDGSITGEKTNLTCLASLNTDDVLAGTTKGGIMKFNIGQQTWEHYGDLDAPMPIKKILVDKTEPNYVYAMTEYEVWYSTSSGTTWEKVPRRFPTKLADIALHNGSTLLVAYGNWLELSQIPWNAWNMFDMKMTGIYDPVTALGAHNQGTYTLLYIGTMKGEVYPMTITSSYVQPLGGIYSTSYGSEIRSLKTVANSPIKTFLITRQGDLSVEYLGNWVEKRTLTECLCAAPASNQDVMIVGSKNGIYSCEVFYPSPAIESSFGRVTDIVYTGSYHLALSDAGPITSPDDGLTWTPSGDGLTSAATFTGLNLLPAGSLTIGDTWEAGQVVVEPGGALYTFSMQGKLALHLDELYSPDQVSVYHNVLVFEYTLNPTEGNNIGGIAYNWKMYFAKGLGLVMIQEYDGTQLLSTSYLDTSIFIN